MGGDGPEIAVFLGKSRWFLAPGVEKAQRYRARRQYRRPATPVQAGEGAKETQGATGSASASVGLNAISRFDAVRPVGNGLRAVPGSETDVDSPSGTPRRAFTTEIVTGFVCQNPSGCRFGPPRITKSHGALCPTQGATGSASASVGLIGRWLPRVSRELESTGRASGTQSQPFRQCPPPAGVVRETSPTPCPDAADSAAGLAIDGREACRRRDLR
jgi:hypothetical protein